LLPDENVLAPITDLFQTRITVGTLTLWTIGSLFHSLYDMLIWYVMACACCHPGGVFYRPDRPAVYKNLGSFSLIPVIFTLLGTAAYLILLRATTEGQYDDTDDTSSANQNDMDNGDNNAYQQQEELENIHWDDLEGVQSFSFLFKSSTELLLAWFVYFPIIGSVLFSGILGCNGRVPILGGRPRDIQLVQREQLEHQQQSSSQYHRSW
jgi:hypothetical protein